MGEDATTRICFYTRKERGVNFTPSWKIAIMVSLTRNSRTCPVTGVIPGVAF